MRKLILIFLVATLVGSVAPAPAPAVNLPKHITISTGPMGTSAYKELIALATLLKKYTSMDVTVESHGGVGISISLLGKGKLNLWDGTTRTLLMLTMGEESGKAKNRAGYVNFATGISNDRDILPHPARG